MVTESIEVTVDASEPHGVTTKPYEGQVLAVPKGTPLAEVEKMYVVRVLDSYQGNKTKTAHELGITIKTLYNKLHEYGLFEQYQTQKKKEVNGNAN